MIEERQGQLYLRVKVVPNASRDQVVGPYGDALKVKVTAPPEAGKANAAVVALVAKLLDVTQQQVAVVSGHTQPRKVLAIKGVTREAATARLAQISK